MADCFNDIEVLWIARFDYKPDWILSSHVHQDFYQLIYCIDGSCTLVLNECRHRISAPALLFFPPKLRHGFVDITGNGLKTLDTKFKIHSKKLSGYSKALAPMISTPPAEIYDILEKIRKNGNARDVLYEEDCQLLLGQVLIELIRSTQKKKAAEEEIPSFPSDREMSPIVNKVFAFIRDNYQQRIDADLLESEMHYSYRYLSKLFLKDLQMTPVEYVERYKIYKAQELLKNTDFEIKYISEILSFSNVHQFSRSFKRNVGIPPAQWRYSILAAVCKDVVIHPGFENTLFIKQLSGGEPSSPQPIPPALRVSAEVPE
jgi:AraC-like DNA-binding protein